VVRKIKQGVEQEVESGNQSTNPAPGRISKLEYLYESEQGKRILGEFLLALSSGAYTNSAAAMLGIAPKTLTKWMKRGRDTSDEPYSRFWGECVVALGKARVQAEIQLWSDNPEYYLRNGAGRLLGDNYNPALSRAVMEHNMDGTVSPLGTGHLTAISSDSSEDEDDDQPASGASTGAEDYSEQAEEQGISQQDLLSALVELRSSGVDLNALIDARLSLLGSPVGVVNTQPLLPTQPPAELGHTHQPPAGNQ
jgi:hypothetical protein